MLLSHYKVACSRSTPSAFTLYLRYQHTFQSLILLNDWIWNPRVPQHERYTSLCLHIYDWMMNRTIVQVKVENRKLETVLLASLLQLLLYLVLKKLDYASTLYYHTPHVLLLLIHSTSQQPKCSHILRASIPDVPVILCCLASVIKRGLMLNKSQLLFFLWWRKKGQATFLTLY